MSEGSSNGAPETNGAGMFGESTWEPYPFNTAPLRGVCPTSTFPPLSCSDGSPASAIRKRNSAKVFRVPTERADDL